MEFLKKIITSKNDSNQTIVNKNFDEKLHSCNFTDLKDMEMLTVFQQDFLNLMEECSESSRNFEKEII